MKKILLFGFLLTLAGYLTAQDTTWRVGGRAALQLNQNYLSNWNAGGQNAVGGIGKFRFVANYAKEKWIWENWLDLAFGTTYFKGSDPIKTDDKIEFISTLGYKLSSTWLATLQGSFRSQFADGFNYEIDSTNYISRLLAPAYITLGPGAEWRPNGQFVLNLSPATARWVIVNDQKLADEGAFGVDPAVFDDNGIKTQDGKRSKFQFGARLMAAYTREVATNVNFGTKLELFSDYLDKPQNLKVDWQVLIDMKVNDWLSAELTTHLIYDEDVIITDVDGNSGPRTQFKQVLSIGLAYNFGHRLADE